MKVLLTGGSGFIGKHLLQELIICGYEVYTLGRNFPENNHNHISFDLLNEYNLASVIDAIEPEILCHLAWETEPEVFWNSDKNVEWMLSTERLVRTFCESGGKTVLISGSCAEYNWSVSPLSESSTKIAANSKYSKYKNLARIRASNICKKFKVKFLWARIFYLYGPGQHHSKFIPSIIAQMINKTPEFRIRENACVDYLYVKDVASAISLLLRSNAEGEFNICSGKGVTNIEIIQTLSSILGTTANEILDCIDNLDSPIDIYGDNSKIKLLGWRQEFSLEEGLRSYLKVKTC